MSYRNLWRGHHRRNCAGVPLCTATFLVWGGNDVGCFVYRGVWGEMHSLEWDVVRSVQVDNMCVYTSPWRLNSMLIARKSFLRGHRHARHPPILHRDHATSRYRKNWPHYLSELVLTYPRFSQFCFASPSSEYFDCFVSSGHSGITILCSCAYLNTITEYPI